MVVVVAGHGYNIGFIAREFLPSNEEFPLIHEDGTTFEAKKIISKLSDDDDTIKTMLCNKIQIENVALNEGLFYMVGRPIGVFAEIIGTEFRFDRKRLVVYLKMYSEVSVCYLVRKLHETFKVRVKVINIDNPDTIYQRTMRYLELSKLNVSFVDIFKKNSPESFSSRLQQIKKPILDNLPNNINNNINHNINSTDIKNTKLQQPTRKKGSTHQSNTYNQQQSHDQYQNQNHDSSLSVHFHDLKSNFHFYQPNTLYDDNYNSLSSSLSSSSDSYHYSPSASSSSSSNSSASSFSHSSYSLSPPNISNYYSQGFVPYTFAPPST